MPFQSSPTDPTPDAVPPSPPMGEEAPGHVTVLLHEAVAALHPRPLGTYVDATFGGGGHTSHLLGWQPPVAKVIAIDADLAAGPRADAIRRQDVAGERLELVHANFRDLGEVMRDVHREPVAGFLFDLGVSSFQFDEGERGFSFRFDAPLDMRFDQSRGATAADLINGLDDVELARLIWMYGEERQSRRIAAAIVREREHRAIATTMDLANLIEAAVGGRRGRPIHPATRTFQALRIAVNGELEALEAALAAVPPFLAPGGRLAVISFHSLEDRIVKRFIEAASRTCVCPPDQPVCTCNTIPTLRRVGKPIRPATEEIERNTRSRSAILRVAERLDATGAVATWQGQAA